MLWLLFLSCITAADIDARVDADGDGWEGDADCAPDDANVHPDADEVCNGVDDDCDGEIDGASALDALSGYFDADGDGFGQDPIRACAGASGLVETSGDCDDTQAGVHPDADEVCNGEDDDCDGVIDGGGAVDAVSGYEDRDGDSFGGSPIRACPGAQGFSQVGDDCDDTDPGRNPAALEGCGNGVDDDCDPATRCRIDGALDWTLAGFVRHTFDWRASELVVGDVADAEGEELIVLGDDGLVRVLAEVGTGTPRTLPGSTWSTAWPNVQLAFPEDLDADGWAEVVSGVPGERVEVRWGSPSGPQAEPDVTLPWLGGAEGTPERSIAVLPSIGGQTGRVLVSVQVDGSPGVSCWALERGDDALQAEDEVFRISTSTERYAPSLLWGARHADSADLLFSPGTGPARGLPVQVPWSDSSTSFFSSQRRAWSGSQDAAALLPRRQGDVDADGVKDVVGWLDPAFSPGSFFWARSPWVEPAANLSNLPLFQSTSTIGHVQGVAMPDLDHDGLADGALLAVEADRWVLFVAYGPGPAGTLPFESMDVKVDLGPVDQPNGIVEAGDVNGDGFEDIIVSISHNEILVWLGSGT